MSDVSKTSRDRKGITVVVPTYNCAELLRMTLETLAKQTMDRARYEVIVVDDGSVDDSADVVDAYRREMDVHFLFQEDRGFRAAAARNLGLNEAKFSITLFLDAGMLVSSRALEMHAARHRSTATAAVIGLSYGVSEYTTMHSDLLKHLAGLPVDMALQRMRSYPQLRDCRDKFMRGIDFDLARMSNPWLIFWSGHVSVSTDMACSIGGFDEWFVTWGGEDVEFGLRLCKAGCSVSALSTIESIHYPHPTDGIAKRDSSRKNLVYMYEKHGCRDFQRLLSETWEDISSLSPPSAREANTS